MRPYLAVLKDSVREALASRVLLVTLAGIVVVLLLLAPFGLTTDIATELRRSELRRPERLLTTLIDGRSAPDTPAAHLWSLLEDEQKEQLQQMLDPEKQNVTPRGPSGGRSKGQLVDRLNALLEHSDFYNATAWQDVQLSDEAEELVERTDLSESELKRRNLLLLQAAFPREIEIVDSNAISLTYGTATVIGPIPLTPTQFEPIFNQALQGVVAIFLGFFGVFGCILVTASVVPRTFEQGEIALLLSKPVNRSLLFVIKVFGGCVFTLFYATVLVAGIWILLGTRMGMWRPELLWCIPVYVFLFIIYYSVSAVAGAIWRNAIVAVVLVIMFWLGLTVIGAAKEGLYDHLVRNRGIKEIIPAGPDILTIDGEQNTFLWNDETKTWDQVFRQTSGRLDQFARMFMASSIRFAPVYDKTNTRILALEQSRSRFGGLAAPQLVSGTAEDEWERVPLGRVPEFAPAVLVADSGRVILPGRNAIYEFSGQTEKERLRADFLGNLTGGLFGGTSDAFNKIHPRDMPDLGENLAAAMHEASGNLLMFGNGKLVHLAPSDDDKYAIVARREFDTEQSGVVALTGEAALLALADGRILAMNPQSLETLDEFQLPDGVLPRMCAAAPDGSSMAVLTHEETVVVLDTSKGKLALWTAAETPVCSAVAYDADGKLLVADGRLAVHQYASGTDSASCEQRWSQQTSWVYQLYDYVINPLWTILPKPSQLDEFVSYVMSGEKTVLVNERRGAPGFINRESLQQERMVFDPVQVIRDNTVFVVVMLLIGCIYISRSDF